MNWSLWRTIEGYGSLAPMRAMWAFVATALVLGSCAQKDWIDRTLVTADVTGTWQGTQSGINMTVQLELEQQGATVKGFLRIVGGASVNVAGVRDGPIEGTVAGDVFRFRQTSGRAEGELTVVSEDEMDGPATIAFTRNPITFRRVARPSSQGSAQPPR